MSVENNSNHIIVKGARVHNLKNIDVKIPRDKLVVVTGLSGSGKTSLVFDTLYAEGQRRYVESLSAYARQFLGRMSKPEVDYIKGIPPAIAIEQKVNTRNPRSTVGTSTEIYEYIKLLYARIGKTYSPVSGDLVKKHEAQDVVEAAIQFPEGTRLMILTEVNAGKQSLREALDVLLKKGFSRVQINGDTFTIQELLAQETITGEKMYLIIDRLTVDMAQEGISRLTDSVETAFAEGSGACVLKVFLADETKTLHFSKCFEADGIEFEVPTVHTFSFNSPIGACPVCEGFGRVIGIDEDLVVPNKSLSVYEDAIFCWRGEVMGEWKKEFLRAAPKFNFPVHKPYHELTDEQKQVLWNGNQYFYGINAFFDMLKANQYKIQYRVMLARYRGKTICPECRGTRLKKEASYIRVSGKSINELVQMSIVKLKDFFDNIQLDKHDAAIAERLLIEINNRLQFLLDVGLGYLTLNRLSNSLSGGESQRINLVTSLGNSLVGSLYILDEPSIGLHPRDTHQLIEVLLRLRDIGNTVVVVEHDEEIMRAADYLIDIGPEAGRKGGEIVYEGKPPKSPKGDFLGIAENKNFAYQTADPILYGKLKELAKQHRVNPTPAEDLLWTFLSNKKLEGYKFRRQHVIGDIIVDFVNLEQQLVVEIDGKYHEDKEIIEYDNLRTAWLESQGYKVIRFTNDEVFQNTDQVLTKISQTLHAPKSPLGDLGESSENECIAYQTENSIVYENLEEPAKKSPLGDLGGYTIKYLLGLETIPTPLHRRKWNNYIEILDARENNLKGINVKFPLNVMTVVTGVSGSGKSSLVKSVFYEALKKYYEDVADKSGQLDNLKGSMHLIKGIEMVDQNPIGRSSRSNPVTYIKAYDEIRNLFADQQLSKQMGYKASHFSFNTPGGRCEECKGEGTVTVEMQFMADLVLECDHCHGKRFQQDVLEVRYKGVNIHDVLEMTVNQAIEFFTEYTGSTQKKIVKRLKPLQDVGIGYVKLGQSSDTLSGGESQRVKLASFLALEKTEPTIFVFDEPTTGLHFHDIKTLLKAFDALIDKGHTIWVRKEVMKAASLYLKVRRKHL
jgi:excinuclease UvrABC ATPase subunit/very-short-patch-repair endonuclease